MEQPIIARVNAQQLIEYLLKAFPQFLSKLLILCLQLGQSLNKLSVIEHLHHGIGYHFIVGLFIGHILVGLFIGHILVGFFTRDILIPEITKTSLLTQYTLVHRHIGLFVGLHKEVHKHFILGIRPFLDEVSQLMGQSIQSKSFTVICIQIDTNRTIA